MPGRDGTSTEPLLRPSWSRKRTDSLLVEAATIMRQRLQFLLDVRADQAPLDHVLSTNVMADLAAKNGFAPMRVVPFLVLRKAWEAGAMKQLSYRDSTVPASELSEGSKVIFVSHRWWSPPRNKPDQTEAGWPKTRALITTLLPVLLQDMGLSEGDIHLWWDFLCVTQDDAELLQIQCESVPVYVAMADAVIACRAGDEQHYTLDKAGARDPGHYDNRAWTALELSSATSSFQRVFRGAPSKVYIADLNGHYDIVGLPRDDTQAVQSKFRESRWTEPTVSADTRSVSRAEDLEIIRPAMWAMHQEYSCASPDALRLAPPPVPTAPSLLQTAPRQAMNDWEEHKLYSKSDVQRHRSALGLQNGENHILGLDGTAELLEDTEFVSLGCFCATARALEFLGLRQRSYPLDWVRSPVEGIFHLLDNRFSDFLTFTHFRQEGDFRVYGGARWGGSFWHHEVEADSTREAMRRRVNRFFGQDSLTSAMKPRIFVRSVNATKELASSRRLLTALRQALPSAKKVQLVVIVDMQDCEGPVRAAPDDNLLIYRIHESVLKGGVTDPLKLLTQASKAYAAGVAFAVRFWAGEASAVAEAISAPSIEDALGQQWDGGDPSRDLWRPLRFRGQVLHDDNGASVPAGLLDPCQVNEVVIPDFTERRASVKAFGRNVVIDLPQEAKPGQILQFSYSNGKIGASIFTADKETTMRRLVGEACIISES